MQHINSLLINSNLALHFVLVHITFYTEIWHFRSNVSWPCLHINHSFSCSFLHNSHSKRWPGISNLPFLGSSSKFCWRRSNPERIIVRRAHFWSELTSLLRGSCNILKERLPKPFFQLVFEDKRKSVLGPKTFPRILLQACSEFRWIMFRKYISEILSCERLYWTY